MTQETSPFKSSSGLARLFAAFRYSAQGLRAAVKHEAAFRQELMACVVLVPLAVWLGDTLGQTLVLIAALLFVLMVELFNSALEAIADSVTLEHHPLIGRAKDLGSAAVLLAILAAAMVWFAVLFDSGSLAL